MAAATGLGKRRVKREGAEGRGAAAGWEARVWVVVVGDAAVVVGRAHYSLSGGWSNA